MAYKEYNNDFFGWYGSINRKNYAINLFIVVALFVLLWCINFQAFQPFITFEFLYHILLFVAGMLKIVLAMSAISLVYRRIADFSLSKSQNFQLNMKRFFVIVFVFPMLYFLLIRYFFDFLQPVIIYMDLFTLFILIPIAIISSLVFCLIKGQ